MLDMRRNPAYFKRIHSGKPERKKTENTEFFYKINQKASYFLEKALLQLSVVRS